MILLLIVENLPVHQDDDDSDSSSDDDNDSDIIEEQEQRRENKGEEDDRKFYDTAKNAGTHCDVTKKKEISGDQNKSTYKQRKKIKGENSIENYDLIDVARIEEHHIIALLNEFLITEMTVFQGGKRDSKHLHTGFPEVYNICQRSNEAKSSPNDNNNNTGNDNDNDIDVTSNTDSMNSDDNNSCSACTNSGRISSRNNSDSVKYCMKKLTEKELTVSARRKEERKRRKWLKKKLSFVKINEWERVTLVSDFDRGREKGRDGVIERGDIKGVNKIRNMIGIENLCGASFRLKDLELMTNDMKEAVGGSGAQFHDTVCNGRGREREIDGDGDGERIRERGKGRERERGKRIERKREEKRNGKNRRNKCCEVESQEIEIEDKVEEKEKRDNKEVENMKKLVSKERKKINENFQNNSSFCRVKEKLVENDENHGEQFDERNVTTKEFFAQKNTAFRRNNFEDDTDFQDKNSKIFKFDDGKSDLKEIEEKKGGEEEKEKELEKGKRLTNIDNNKYLTQQKTLISDDLLYCKTKIIVTGKSFKNLKTDTLDKETNNMRDNDNSDDDYNLHDKIERTERKKRKENHLKNEFNSTFKTDENKNENENENEILWFTVGLRSLLTFDLHTINIDNTDYRECSTQLIDARRLEELSRALEMCSTQGPSFISSK